MRAVTAIWPASCFGRNSVPPATVCSAIAATKLRNAIQPITQR
jgi:hypothetical protein